jgi:hypothetical protein
MAILQSTCRKKEAVETPVDADLSLKNLTLKKASINRLRGKRFEAEEKAGSARSGASAAGSEVQDAWQTGPFVNVLSLAAAESENQREGETGLVDRRPQPTTTWNWLRREEGQMILGLVLLVSREPDHSPREIVCWIMDNRGFAISQVSVRRVLRWQRGFEWPSGPRPKDEPHF